MATVHELFSEEFYRWEQRGRGWQVFPMPVAPEPPFVPFPGYQLPAAPPVDDGRRPTFLSSMVDRLRRKLSTEPAVTTGSEEDEQPAVATFERGELVELVTALPAKVNIHRDAFAEFLQNISRCRESVAFEVLGTAESITAQFVAGTGDAPHVRRQLSAYFPEAVFIPKSTVLTEAWEACEDGDTAVIEFGLEHEFFLPLASGKLDPFIGLIAAVGELAAKELGLFQVIFQPAHEPWTDSLTAALSTHEDKPFFVNAPELLAHARAKASRPLFGAVVRLATRAQTFDRAWQIAAELASSLRVFAHPEGNELVPLTNDDYPYEAHLEDVLLRQSRRSGMLLTSDELIGFVHLPGADVRSPKLTRASTRTKAAPAALTESSGLCLGMNEHAGVASEVFLTPDQRVCHVHALGATGTGKSTFLFNLIRQDIESGRGIGLLDPHGDLVERVLGVIPSERIDDVVLIDPSDEEFSVGFNILSAHSDREKTLLASDLVSVFQRLSSSWGEQMESVLRNAVLAFLESSRGGTLVDLRRFLLEPRFRAEFLQTVRDPHVLYYWQTGFPKLTGNKSIGPLLTRLDAFLAPKPVRHMVSQRVNRLDFRRIFDEGKILLIKLPQGHIGREDACLLGSLFMAKFQQTAMSRQGQAQGSRRDFQLYVDEFQNFITPSLAEILTGTRKYRLGLVLAHQDLRQLERDREVASAVFGSLTRVVFRVGDEDARKLADGFASFEARDLQNLGPGEAVCRVERSEWDFNLKVTKPVEMDSFTTQLRRKAVIAASRAKYSTARAEIEAMTVPVVTAPAAVSTKRPPPPEPPPAEPLTAHPPPRPSAPPSPAEVPKATVSEKESVSTPSAASAKPVTSPADLGRGGAQHQAIQHRLKAAAEALGFRATVELSVLNGDGSVDLALEKPGHRLACEIAVTTTTDHEFGNVAKCLKAGFPFVAVLSPKAERLTQIAEAVKAGLGQEAGAKVAFFLPDDFIAHLKTLSETAPPHAPTATLPAESVSHGYKVKRHTPKLTPEELKAKEAVAVQMIADALKRNHY